MIIIILYHQGYFYVDGDKIGDYFLTIFRNLKA
jgi:hypothetical protein